MNIIQFIKKYLATAITFGILCILVFGTLIFFMIRGTETYQDRMIGKQYLDQMLQHIDILHSCEQVGTILQERQAYYYSYVNNRFELIISVKKYNGVPLNVEKYIEQHPIGRQRKLIVQIRTRNASTIKADILYEKQWE